MDILEMLSQATVLDINGVGLGDVMGINIVAGKIILSISLDLFDEDGDDDDDDPDDGEKDDIPEDDASNVRHLTVVAMKGKAEGGSQ